MVQQIKSPSDTTLYRPALNKDPKGAINNLNPVDQISNFVERIWQQGVASPQIHHIRTPEDALHPSTSQWVIDQDNLQNQRSEAARLIVQAKQFKASIAQPTGNDINVAEAIATKINNEPLPQFDVHKFLHILIESQDDEYIHLMCHIETGLKERIEKREFIDLETLLPQACGQIMNDD